MLTNDILDLIIKDLEDRAELLKELSSDTKSDSLLYESIGVRKSIEIVAKYKEKK